ncbi:secretin N-terminal domain-containing protein [Zavarzinella formosa]|uniref:secretin N-terminal domain-containing protein n=1 Tax=Zavarzinella formosa TaxID=360055 RepID=UPI0002F4983A|nr:secretin N-terminal domain-containing protein [Zavarzinella formosa]
MRMPPTRVVLMMALFAFVPAASADGPKPTAPPPPMKPQRVIFPIQNNDAASLAEMAGKLFKGDVEILASPSGNSLVLSGPPASVDEALKMIEILDRSPRSVEVEIILAEVPKREGAELTPAEIAKAADLVKAGSGQRVTLTAIEGHPVSSTTGGNKPVVTSMTGGGFDGGPGGGGPGARGAAPVRKSITYHSIGTTIQVTARVVTNDAITLDLSVQDTKLRPADSGDEASTGGMDTISLATKLNIQPGKTVVARAVRVEGKAGATVSVIIVSAKVIGSTGKGKQVE